MTTTMNTATHTNAVQTVCQKCAGTGRWINSYGRDGGNCYGCGGKGVKQTYARPVLQQVDQPPKHSFPKLMRMVVDKNVKFHIQGAKVIRTLAGKYYLAGPLFGDGIFGTFSEAGSFWPNSKCTLGMIQQLNDIEENGIEAAKRISAMIGSCCVCGKTLTAESSIADGIGPICSGKF